MDAATFNLHTTCAEHQSFGLHWGWVIHQTLIFQTLLWGLRTNKWFHFTSLAYPSPGDILVVVNCHVVCWHPSRTTPTLPLLFSCSAGALSCPALPQALTSQSACARSWGRFQAPQISCKNNRNFFSLDKYCKSFLKIDITTYLGFKQCGYLV